MRNYKFLAFSAFFLFHSVCNAQNVYWVINTNDTGLGSLRQAIIDANSNVSTQADTIKFNISGTSVHTISPTYNLPVITNPVVIDGLSQPGVSTNSWPVTLKIELEGSLIGSTGEGLIVSSGKSLIRGLVINRFGSNGIRLVTGGLNKVETCFIGTDSTGTNDLGNGSNGIFIASSDNEIGGNNYQLRNLISGNDLTAITINGTNSKYNKILGNYIGTDASGLGALGNGGKTGVWEDLYRAIYLNNGASYNTIGDTDQDERNIISGNLGHGIFINSGTFNTIQNNYIGIDATGGNALGNAYSGITIYAGQFNTVGGITNQGRGNIISDNDAGIVLTSYSNPAKHNDIFDNTIGLSAGGIPMGNYTGIVLSMNATENGIHWNTIANNLGDGIMMTGNGVFNNNVTYNEIYLNNGLGIDLNDDGPTPNDTLDSDGGSNLSQNFPILTSVFLNNDGKIEVEGVLNSVPNKDYSIHLFANSMCNSTIPGQNFGEGEKPIGNMNVTTNSNGEIQFTTELEGVFAPGRHITALAVDEDKNISEFSSCISIPNWPTLGFGLNDEVRALAIDSNGVLYAGGDFTLAGNVAVNYLAKWDGVRWSSVGEGTNAPVYALHFDQAGNLLVGGDFTTVGAGVSANRIAKWDGNTWSVFGLGMNDRVKVIATSLGGTIYAGGSFTAADGNTQIQGIARWNLNQWVPLGTETYNIHSMIVTPNAEVIAGGNFTFPNPLGNYTIAKWNGANWEGLYPNSSTAGVKALVRKSNGHLFAADGHYLLEYDGNNWSTIPTPSGISSIKSLLLDTQENLFLGGQFYFSDGQGKSVKNLAMWDGSNFYTVGGGLHGYAANALSILGNELFVGGEFERANGVQAENIARFWTNYINPAGGNQASARFAKTDGSLNQTLFYSTDQGIYPNPFHSTINISFETSKTCSVSVNIFNSNGQLTKALFQGKVNKGNHLLSWDGISESGHQLPQGTYICVVKTDDAVKYHKLILVR